MKLIECIYHNIELGAITTAKMLEPLDIFRALYFQMSPSATSGEYHNLLQIY